MDLWDVYENSKYGSVSEDHMNFPKTETKEKVFRCELLDKTCKTVQEWNGLAYSYLND